MKYITLCKIPVHIGVKGNEVVNKAAKYAPGMSEMATIKLIHRDIKRARNWNDIRKTVLENYQKSIPLQ